MGSSTKRKKEKRKDFQVLSPLPIQRERADLTEQKARLRVGKTRSKASNFTDTSFASKSMSSHSVVLEGLLNCAPAVVLNKQSLSTSAPSSSAQFSHHMSLLSSRSESQRRESLTYLASAIMNRPVGSPIEQPLSVFLPKVLPLSLDGNRGVRTQLVKLLHTLPTEDIDDHIDQVLLYIRAGLTHLAADIRVSAIDVLEWALRVAGQELVSCAGGWVKTLKCFMTVLNWVHVGDSALWTSSKASYGKVGHEGKSLVKSLTVLGLLLEAGLSEHHTESAAAQRWPFPLADTCLHILPTESSCFAHLSLFGLSRDEEDERHEDREIRRRVYRHRFEAAVKQGLETTRREGGEIGRAASAVEKIVIRGMKS